MASMVDLRSRFNGTLPNSPAMMRAIEHSIQSTDCTMAMHDDGYPVMVPDENRSMMGGHELEVGDIIRKAAGWTPMAVVGIKSGVILACYCGDYFDPTIADFPECRESGGFVLVTDPEKEFWRCDQTFGSDRDWKHRLSEEQHAQLAEQVKMHKCKKKGKSAMKTRTELLNIAALTSNEVTTIVVLLVGNLAAGSYTFLAKRSLAESITEEDTYVVVETTYGLTIGIVKEIHAEITIETMDKYRMRWAFMQVACDELEGLNNWQEQVADKLNTAQRRVTKQSALQALGLGDDEVQALPSLSPPADDTVAMAT